MIWNLGTFAQSVTFHPRGKTECITVIGLSPYALPVMVSLQFVQHRLFIYGKKRGQKCDNCSNWLMFDTKDTILCDNPHCPSYGSPMKAITPQWHEKQEQSLRHMSICIECKQVYRDCRCAWKQEMNEKKRMDKCTYCSNEKTHIVFVYVCNDERCTQKAREDHMSLGISRTKFGANA